MNTTAAVDVRGLRKSYDGTTAVGGIDLEIAHGEVFALLGPNGAGKTTTVEILEGYRKRDSGEVHVLGIDPGDADLRWRARIGIVLQNTGGHDDLSVEEVIRHFALYYPDARDPDEVIAAVGLDGKRDTRVRQLSGGQRRRLDVALGILGRPELLFLDEPTTGFDPEARREFWTLISALSDGGTTILLTTHYLDEAERLADRVGVIAAGDIVALDSPARLGGRERDLATVRWLHDGNPQERTTAEPTRLVTELAAEFDGEIPGLAIDRPTLEDTYLRLIGENT
ncbi:ABC transporter ATP-binding protein [Actinobacteria bacterium YIM 96077]|uniref:ABC transporter ATP-binding protein n=1 Tax=Phytoactinopolyspora halophila TaxID=1981511 RepID=A0A329QRE4_9ACTN|nr:ABC transporter ATP-binding protein [Phytoactinopolyspora halophila]AYY14231.1 ABC transporter ATP-binding protein [Actinobacteria bacterium YIM 96077]RAW14773.1 ABC transporter ATP-binding protein [Phytoactinopolyspora halophila]